jgi:predicted metal-dependent hydrolase
LIYCPESIPVESDEFQQFVQKAIVETLRREAKAYLPMRLSVLAKETGFHYKSIDIKNAKTRWGSCSHDNRINLNLHLMRLPDDLIDMVLLHELCHVKEKNHSQAFWKLLSGFCTNLEEKKKRLKNYSTTIF